MGYKNFAARKKQICFLLVKTTFSADAESFLYQVLRFAINDGEGEIDYFHFKGTQAWDYMSHLFYSI
jgi:hypothetical protein